MKTTRSSNQRQYTIELPDEGMVDDMDPSTERRCAINRNNENAKVINIDVSDVMKLLKYMHAGISRFFIPNFFRPKNALNSDCNTVPEKKLSFRYSAKTKYFENGKQNTF
jgi:hypothetical protein